MSEPSYEIDPIDDLADAFLERYRRGERPSLSEYTEGTETGTRSVITSAHEVDYLITSPFPSPKLTN